MLDQSKINLLESKRLFKFLKDKNYDWYQKLIAIAGHYKKALNTGSYFSETAYTPHDFENHCMDIFGVLDDIIRDEHLESVINAEEIFVLLVAVILHDIGMAYNPGERDFHSENAKKYIRDQVYKNNDSVLSNFLTKQQAQAVAFVVFGHSDLKKEKEIDTLSELPKKGEQPIGDMDEINVLTLAALLRLADELDVTSKRINGIKIENYDINDSSKRFWERCELFKAVRVYSCKMTVIQLEVDEDAFEVRGNKLNDIKEIRFVKNKIQKELNRVNEILTIPGYFQGWTLSNVIIKANDEILELLDKDESTNPLEEDDSNIDIKQIDFNDQLKKDFDMVKIKKKP